MKSLELTEKELHILHGMCQYVHSRDKKEQKLIDKIHEKVDILMNEVAAEAEEK